MLRLLTDEDFDGDIIKGLLQRQGDLDLVRAVDVGLRATPDPVILEWASREDRIVLTHDRGTMADFGYARIEAGLPTPGVIVVSKRIPIGRAIEEILIAALLGHPDDFRDQVKFQPL